MESSGASVLAKMGGCSVGPSRVFVGLDLGKGVVEDGPDAKNQGFTGRNLWIVNDKKSIDDVQDESAEVSLTKTQEMLDAAAHKNTRGSADELTQRAAKLLSGVALVRRYNGDLQLHAS